MCKKQINFQCFLLFAIEMQFLVGFLQKNGLGPLGVKIPIPTFLVCRSLIKEKYKCRTWDL